MNVLTILWTICLVSLCQGNGGNEADLDANGPFSSSEGAQNTPANLQGSGNDTAKGPDTVEGSNNQKVDVYTIGFGNNLRPQNSPEATGQEHPRPEALGFRQVGQQSHPGPTTPVKPVSRFSSKADASLFNVLCSVEDNVKILKLTPKAGKVTELKYDGKDVWSGKATLGKSSNLVEALIYFDENAPALAIISTDKNSKVYRYHDGNEWKKSNKSDFKRFLKKLKEIKGGSGSSSPGTTTPSQ
ncbi:signal peptide-containing protein [Theileria equi strain WA]|uniref:Signal peptide-containing protein n=1 Tax=Theileria equi strain WA TaxID=1537102 RepID=L0AYW5_THEEQ|nr:signal peptide-containing protein [Theileria equi strain WA]AFZ80787.1 signal peptide-containing protein [Theileria equi strain WA]|eukprot:XP_004830453.1 signal peptide-containing protein [Theileria equi strain WA]